MLYHYVVFLEFFIFYLFLGLVQFVEPKFTISRTVFLGRLFVFFIVFLSLRIILSKNT